MSQDAVENSGTGSFPGTNPCGTPNFSFDINIVFPSSFIDVGEELPLLGPVEGRIRQLQKEDRVAVAGKELSVDHLERPRPALLEARQEASKDLQGIARRELAHEKTLGAR